MLDITQLSNSCIKCAKCVPSCTIYKINKDETTSPRGFIELINAYNKNKIKLDNNLKNIFESCFCCTDCTTKCPITIDTANMIIKTRIDIAQKFGIRIYKKIYFYIIKHRKIMDFIFSFTYFIAPCLFKKNNDKLRSKFNISNLGKRTIPIFNKKSFLQQNQKIINKKKYNITNAPKVAIFIGCLSNYNYKEVGESLLDILKILGINVLIPKQECCGAPAYFSGDIKSVNYLIKKNIINFENIIDEVDAIITPEATCGAMILKNWRTCLEYETDSKIWLNKLNKISSKVSLATTYLYNKTNLINLLDKKPKQKTKVTYHDPCHSKKVLNIYKEPRELINKNYNLVEMEECDRCCGFGGINIQIEKYNIAYKSGIQKAKHIENSKANIVSAECNACRMQLNNAIDNKNINAVFKHPLELIKQILINN